MKDKTSRKQSLVRIIDYIDEHQPFLKKLNYEWLEKYFKVEASDEASLSNPREYIIDKGGIIYMAELDDAIVGCAALLKVNDDVFELAKMAVSPQAQGYGIGTTLLKHGISLAKQMNSKKLILYSNTGLKPALHLYRKYSFKEIPLEERLYDRADIKMELDLT